LDKISIAINYIYSAILLKSQALMSNTGFEACVLITNVMIAKYVKNKYRVTEYLMFFETPHFSTDFHKR